MRRFVIGALFVVLVGTPAFAGTDQQAFNKLLAKLTGNAKKFDPRVACVCVPSGQPGYIIQVPALNTPIYCVAPTFNPDGSFASHESCPGNTFEVLGR